VEMKCKLSHTVIDILWHCCHFLQMWTYHTFKQWPATVFSISLVSTYHKLAISIWNDWSYCVYSICCM